MERIEFYSSKKKSFLTLILSLPFLGLGICFLLYTDTFTRSSNRDPLFLKALGLAVLIMAALAIYVTTKQLITSKLQLVIDQTGIIINPIKAPTEYIEWKNIIGFYEVKIQQHKILMIDIDNTDYWIEKEKNTIRRNLLKANIQYHGTLFHISASTMQITHAKLSEILYDKLVKYQSLKTSLDETHSA